MGKAPRNIGNVNLEDGVLHGALQQVKWSNSSVSDPLNPELVSVWCCDVEVHQTKLIVQLMTEDLTPHDEVSLVHIKRLKKADIDSNLSKSSVVIRAVLCSTEFIKTETELLHLFDRFTDSEFDKQQLKFSQIKVPRFLPTTKEIALKWSSEYWPMSWKGNPNHQALLSAEIEIDTERSLAQHLIESTRTEVQTGSKLPLVTVIAKVSDNGGQAEILATSADNRDEHILNHSIMKAIKEIADKELLLREADLNNGNNGIDGLGYLCHNLVVYTTFEPCVMCSMALVHSRIGRLVYFKERKESGGISSSYFLGDRDGLNWKFDIWKWVGKDELHKLNAILSSEVDIPLNA